MKEFAATIHCIYSE